ncbi:uncharacterized protein TrAFT101_008480 [Trichoderma asperellum]|uniref:uncharacterized protein n=1 Tax=Trichoderma asperellum TaxID=101201 RepID=UPI00332C092D|nr:hypothetical protein TrAFT101_008480 [Trichoderma asperellum]
MRHNKNANAESADSPAVLSKKMDPFPDSFLPIFIQNQFRTKIELPTKERYPSVQGKCAIITGSNTGLGFESARQLLALGLSHLVMAVRSLEKGNEAAKKLHDANPAAKIHVWKLDMESYDSVQTFVDRCHRELDRLDIAILNAGLSPLSFSTCSTGHEKTMQVNHFSTALLAVLLLPCLKSKARGNELPHLTIVNSVTAHLCKFPNRNERPLLASFDDTNITAWDPQERYGVSKLISQLFLVKLADLVNPDNVVINMVDPGLTKGTSLARDAKGAIGVAVKGLLAIAGRPTERGSATYVDAVLGHGKDSHGCFLMNCKNAPLASWFYTDGIKLTDLVWNETLQEFKFANLEDIIASMQ